MSETGHVIDFKKAKVQAQAKSKGSRLVQEAWLSGPNVRNRSIKLHPSFLTLRHKLQQEGKRRIPLRNNSNNYKQQSEQFDQVGESHNAETMFQWAITRSRARVSAVRIPRTQNTD